MTDLKNYLLELNKNLSILREREAKYGGNAPLELLNQIEDHEQAIFLTEQALAGQIAPAQYETQIKPLLVKLSEAKTYIDQRGQYVEQQTNVAGDLIQHTTNIYQSLTLDPDRPPPFMADPLPPDFIQRPTEFEQLIHHLLAEDGQTVAITAALQGAGGFGKTTLAQALCHDERVKTAFAAGILWVTLGDEANNVIKGLQKLYRTLTGQEAQFVDSEDGVNQLRVILAERYCLIVVDDVWNAAHLHPFLRLGPTCTYLVTTRLSQVIPKEAQLIPVDAMQVSEAVRLLGAGLDLTLVKPLAELAGRLGEWPLLLRLVNRVLYNAVEQNRLSLAQAIAEVQQELDEFGLTTFDIDNPGDRNQAVAASMGLSIGRLQTTLYGPTLVDEPARFRELAIFPEDVAVPLTAIAALWGKTGGMSLAATKRLCRKLADLALALRYDQQQQTLRLHDVTRHYLLSIPEAADNLVVWHNSLLSAYQDRCGGDWTRGPDDGYCYQYLLWHFAQARRHDEIEPLLMNFQWLQAKLDATNFVSLMADFELDRRPGSSTTLTLLKDALRLSTHVLVRDKSQLAGQLLGRLSALPGETLQTLLTSARSWSEKSWLRPRRPTLIPPGGPLRLTLTGHTAEVSNLLLTPEGRLISSCRRSGDSTIKVWDLTTGQLLHSLEGHTAGVDNLLLTPEGRLISSCSSSGDSTIKVWDLTAGQLLHSLEGHTAEVSNLLLTPEGRLISSCINSISRDSTINAAILSLKLNWYRDEDGVPVVGS